MSSTMHDVINIVITFLVAVAVISVIVLVNYTSNKDHVKGLKS